MKRAAFGLRVHSGWAALVAVAGKPGAELIIQRRRIEVIDPKAVGATQPFHFAQKLKLAQAEKHVAACAAVSARLALAALGDSVEELQDRGYCVVAGAILLSSGRPLPPFPQILASHPLIHTAEGEFFRQAFRSALEKLKIPVSGIRERELEKQAGTVLGKAAPRIRKAIAGFGRSLGPPWTTDQKNAALAAVIVLKQA